jgi:hypothetical protein
MMDAEQHAIWASVCVFALGVVILFVALIAALISLT